MSERPPRRIVVVANPISGNPRSHERLPVFLDVLKGSGAEVRLAPTEGPGHATELGADACRRGCDAIVAVGGDGTVNEVLNGLAPGEGPALGTLPLGTSSIFARDLRIPFDPAKAAGVVLRGRRRRLDVGTVNGRRFLMVVGVGWDAHVVNAFAEARRGHGGKARYLAPIAKALVEYDFPELTVALDDAPPRAARIAFVCNIRNYAAFFRIAPEAAPDDGRLDLVTIRDKSARNYLKWILAAYLGTLPRYREVEYRKGTRIRIDADRPVPFEVDGDPGGTTPVDIALAPAALEVLVP